jgi:hypothetical protein
MKSDFWLFIRLGSRVNDDVALYFHNDPDDPDDPEDDAEDDDWGDDPEDDDDEPLLPGGSRQRILEDA